MAASFGERDVDDEEVGVKPRAASRRPMLCQWGGAGVRVFSCLKAASLSSSSLSHFSTVKTKPSPNTPAFEKALAITAMLWLSTSRSPLVADKEGRRKEPVREFTAEEVRGRWSLFGGSVMGLRNAEPKRVPRLAANRESCGGGARMVGDDPLPQTMPRMPKSRLSCSQSSVSTAAC